MVSCGSSYCTVGRVWHVLDFVSILLQTHLTFGSDFTAAVEQKQVAQQDAEKARYVVEKVLILKVASCNNVVYQLLRAVSRHFLTV